MANEYTAVVKEDGGSWIGWIEEVPGVNCQETTREELLESLRVTLVEALEFNREDARRMGRSSFEEALLPHEAAQPSSGVCRDDLRSFSIWVKLDGTTIEPIITLVKSPSSH